MPETYHRIKLPLPFALGHLNVYLVPDTAGWTLIDCGMETPASEAALDESLSQLGVSRSGIHTVVLTHLHPDHAGLASKLHRETGARLLAHPEELGVLESVLTGERSRWQDDVLRSAGAPEDMVQKVRASFNALRRAINGLKAGDIEPIGSSVGGLEVIWTGGHSRGHVCLWDATTRRLFSGDQIMEKGPPNIGWEDDQDALAVFLESLDRLYALDADLILPAHGDPFTGHRPWIERSRAHHVRRCDRIGQILSAAPASPHTIAMTIWPGAVTPLDYRFAVFEILAHLVHMERVNRVKRTGDTWSLVAPGERETIQ